MAASDESVTRERMLGDVVARCNGTDAFVCDPERAARHVRIVESLHAWVPIHTLPGEALATRTEGQETFTYVPGLDDWLLAASQQGLSLADAGAPWAAPRTFSAAP